LETNSGDTIPLDGSCALGRHPSSTLHLADKQVSRRHALIHTQGNGQHWLVDLGSSNGTILNGRRVRQPVALKDGDRLRIGSSLVIFRKTDAGTGSFSVDTTATDGMTVMTCATADLWLLVADIEKFTPLSQTMPGDQLAEMVGKWIFACKEAIEKNSGEINQYLGDGFLAYWPSPETPSEAIAGTMAELKRIQASSPMKFRVAVHYGAITVDSALSPGEDSLIGANVNFVFRMEKIASGLQQYCVLSEEAAGHLGQFGAVMPLGEHSLSGFSGTHALYSY